MPLAALILAEDEGSERDGPSPASVMLAGQTLVEYQLRAAHAAGAGHLVVLARQLPGALIGALDRVRRDGLNVELARTPQDAADRIHPDEQLLVVAGGICATAAVIAQVVSAPGAHLLVLPRGIGDPRLERIDGSCDWTGLALLDGGLLRQTAALVGDWALGPTLLRGAVQANVARTPLASEHVDAVHLVTDLSEAHQAVQILLAAACPAPGSAGEALLQPLARWLAPLALRFNPNFVLMALLPLLFDAVALALAATGWLICGLSVYALAILPAALARLLGNVTVRGSRWLRWHDRFRAAGPALLMLIAGLLAWQSGAGWGAIVLGGWGASGLVRPALNQWAFARGGDWAVLLLLVALIAGAPLVGLAAVALLAAGLGLWQDFDARDPANL